MSRPIAINGTRLDEVRMPLAPYDSRMLSFLSYPTSQFRITRSGRTISLTIPANLAVELYRIGILPQDANTPVAVSIDGRPVGRYVVSDVRYPNGHDGVFDQIAFTFADIDQGNVAEAAAAPARPRSTSAPPGVLVADITHYLDETGAVAPLPGPARKLASFLTLLIDAATSAFPERESDSGVRCRQKGCRGTIRTSLPTSQGDVAWQCPACGHQGIISNWQQTTWNRLKPSAGSR